MHKPRIYAIVAHVIVGTALAGVLSALPAMAESQVRIVRLSDVKGTVQIDKNSGLGFENAFANLPITQGTQLRTRDNGRAEVEFEDGSTLRIIPNTTVEFDRLGLSDDGQAHLDRGVGGRQGIRQLAGEEWGRVCAELRAGKNLAEPARTFSRRDFFESHRGRQFQK